MNRVRNAATSEPSKWNRARDLKPCKLYHYDDDDDDDDEDDDGDDFSPARNCVYCSVGGTADEKDFLLRN